MGAAIPRLETQLPSHSQSQSEKEHFSEPFL